MVVHLPNRLDVAGVVKFLNVFEESCFFHSGKLTIDCSKLGHVEPFPMLLLVNGVKSARRANPDIQFFMRGPFPQYPTFMGLFKNCGFNVEYDPQYSKGNKRYQQISVLERATIVERVEQNWAHPIDEVQIEAAKIAKVLAQSERSDLFRILSYMLTEIMRNWFEHSESSKLYSCAQHWPNLDKVECGILDVGIGLRASLRKNQSLNVPNDTIALNVALQPGISGKQLKKGKSKDPWANSGYGLYMTSKLCEAGGSFLLMSGERGMLTRNYRTTLFKCALSGTGVQIVLKPSKMTALDISLAKFRVEAGIIGRHTVHSASTFSRIIDSKKENGSEDDSW